jgi:hypothetical protein
MGLRGYAGLLLLFLTTLELAARCDDHLTWGAPLWGPYSFEHLTVTDDQGTRGRPNACYEKWCLNSWGFRGPEIAMEKPDGVIRVAVLGASEVFGQYEDPGKEIPAQIQARLDRRAPGRFQVINAACSGMSPPQVARHFQDRVRRFAPDIAVFYPTPQFYLNNRPPGAPPSRPDHPAPPLRVFQKTKTVCKRLLPGWLQTELRSLAIQREVRDHPPGWVWNRVPADRVALFRRDLDVVIDVVWRAGTCLVLATHASGLSMADRHQLVALRKFYPRASPAALLGMNGAINDVIRATGTSRGVPVVDLHHLLGKRPELFADFSHFTNEGAALAADHMVRAVLRHVDHRSMR